MVVRNQKALNACSYNKIYIGDNVNVYGGKRRLETILITKFTDSIKGLSDIEKKQEIVRYFLRNNRICSVRFLKDKFEYVDNIGVTYKEYLVVQSLNGKTLRIRKEDVSDELLKEIYFKYECDRLDYFTNNEFDGYVIHQGVENPKFKSYFSENIEDYYRLILPDEFIGKNILFLSFEPTNGKINDVDKKILEIILYSGEMMTVDGFLGSYVYRIKTGDRIYKYLKIDSKLDYDVFYPMVRKREESKKEEKKMVLRMEEFK